MKRLLKFSMCSLILLAGLLLLTGSAAADDVPRFEETSCPDHLATLPNFECGYLIVPEVHANPEGKTIRLMVATIHSRSTLPKPDPVIYLAGGPGSPAVGSAGTSLMEDAILAERDLIYLDQRGVGYSEPDLNCPELAQLSFSTDDQTAGFDMDALLANVRACRDRLKAQGVELSAYTTAQSAADVAALREVLGYPEWNLWGASYGTYLALTIMRDYPAGIRSAVLEGVSPPDVDLSFDRLALARDILGRMFDDCADRFICNLMYPHLAQTFDDLVAELNQQPVIIPVTNPKTGETGKFLLTGEGVLNGAGRLVADPAAARYLPAIIEELIQHDFSRVSGLVIGLGLELDEGLALSDTCIGYVPFLLESPNQPDFDFERAICQNWLGTIPAPDPHIKEPTYSDIPTLLLSGKFDTLTPSQWAAAAAEKLPNSYAYEFGGLGHGVLLRPCPVGMAISFLNEPKQAPESSCIQHMPDLSFVIPIERTRTWGRGSALVLGVLGLLGVAALLFMREPLSIKTSLRLIGMLPLFLSGGLLLVLIFGGSYEAETLRMVEVIIPLAITLQTILVFSPDTEPSLEILMTCPRRILWTPLERFGTVFALQSGLALLGCTAALWVTGGNDVAMTLVRWIPPAFMLSGIGLYVTLRSRSAIFGATVTLLVWFTMLFLGGALLPGQYIPRPFDYVQPFLWVFQPYLKPEDLNQADYWLNRLVVLLTGINLLALALWGLRNEERILFGQSSQKGISTLWKTR